MALLGYPIFRENTLSLGLCSSLFIVCCHATVIALRILCHKYCVVLLHNWYMKWKRCTVQLSGVIMLFLVLVQGMSTALMWFVRLLCSP